MTNEKDFSSELVPISERVWLTAVMDILTTTTTLRDSAPGRLVFDFLSLCHGKCHFGSGRHVRAIVHSRNVCSDESVEMKHHSSNREDLRLVLVPAAARMPSIVMDFNIIMPPRNPAANQFIHYNLMHRYGNFQSHDHVVDFGISQEYRSIVHHIMSGSSYLTEVSSISARNSNDMLFDCNLIASTFDTSQMLLKYCLHTKLQWEVAAVFSLITDLDEYTVCRTICSYLSYQDLRTILHAYFNLCPSEAEDYDFHYSLNSSMPKK